MTLPPSLVAAAVQAVPYLGLDEGEAGAIALAVLRAALTGEGVGPYTVAWYGFDERELPDAREWAVEGPWAPHDAGFTKAEAEAIAAALNLLPALEAP